VAVTSARSVLYSWVVEPLKIIASNRKALVGFIMLLFYIGMAIYGAFFVSPVLKPSCPPYLPPTLFRWPPSLSHPLGCDYMGYDIWVQLLLGAPAVLTIAFVAGFVTTAIGVAIGITSGYLGGLADTILMGITDVAMTIPGLPLLIVLATVFFKALSNMPTWMCWIVIGLILSVTAWAGLARSIRSQVLSLRAREFIEAAKALGLPTWHIVFREIMPNIMSYIAINFIFATVGAIYASVGLYFLGLLPYTTTNWGVMLNYAYSQQGALYSLSTIHYLLAPIIAIVGFQTALILFSYAVDEIFNPRLRAG